jgi:uncharacterized protein YggL (DUF469 family)
VLRDLAHKKTRLTSIQTYFGVVQEYSSSSHLEINQLVGRVIVFRDVANRHLEADARGTTIFGLHCIREMPLCEETAQTIMLAASPISLAKRLEQLEFKPQQYSLCVYPQIVLVI